MISPLNLSKTAQNSLKVNFGSAEKMTSPSASPVEVFSPNFTVVKYSLSALSKSAENFVAYPKHKGSSPLAKGSSVPVWPAFCAFRRRRAFCKALLLDKPTGLSSNKTPSIFKPLRRRPNYSPLTFSPSSSRA